MPTLPREPDIFPENLLESPPVAGVDGDWWAVYTKSRQEKVLMRFLRQREIGHYCPLVPKKNRLRNGRIRTSYNPLFSGYVFLFGDRQARDLAYKSNVISRTLEVKNPEELIADLQRVHRAIQSGLPLLPEDKLESGDRVRIKTGSLAGMEGVVIRRQGEDRLLIAVHFLQKGASIRLDLLDVEPV
ncbi:transcription termination/antitermination NusG family protein [Thermostilla marina]